MRSFFGGLPPGVPNPDKAEIGNNIKIPNSNGFVSSIATHPKDGNKLVVVFSNYNVYSLFYSENGGATWQNISGDLEGEMLKEKREA